MTQGCIPKTQPCVYSHLFCQGSALFPHTRQEIDQAWDGIAVWGKTVAQHEAEKAPAKADTKQP